MISPQFSAIIAIFLLSVPGSVFGGDWYYNRHHSKKTASPTKPTSAPPTLAILDTTIALSNESTSTLEPISESTLSSLAPSPSGSSGAPMISGSTQAQVMMETTVQNLVKSTESAASVPPTTGSASSESPLITELPSESPSSEIPITELPSSQPPSRSPELPSNPPTELPSNPSTEIQSNPPTELPANPSTEISSNPPTEPPSQSPKQTSQSEAPIVDTTMIIEQETEMTIPPVTEGSASKVSKKRTRRPHTVAPTFPPVDFDCSNKDDGYHPDPKDKCSWKFYACVGGNAIRMDCSSRDLVYEPETGTCERRQDSFRCTGIRKTTIRSTRGPQVTHKPRPKLPIECSNLGDGWYPDPEKKCSHVFYSCSNGIGSRFNCPGNMYYDKDSMACESFQDVEACAGKKPVTTPKTTLPTTPREKVPVDCSNLPSGLYADPAKKCSNIYYVCSNGDGIKRNCPPRLYYDEKRQLCDYRDEIVACAGHGKKTTARPSTKAPNPTVASLHSKEYDCKGKEDGSYLPPSQNCSSYYFRCVGGAAYKLNCPSGLYYDAEQDWCERRDNVFACSGKRPTSPKPITTVKPKPTEKLPIDCNTLSDNDYPNPEKKCSKVYYTCSGLLGFKRRCPSGLYFDKDLRICDSKDNVPDCSGKPRQTTKLTTIRPIEVTKPAYNCQLKSDGNYEAGKCVSHYFSCVGGSAIKVTCPKGTAYDSESDECGYKEEIPACGGVRPTSKGPKIN